MKRYLGLFAFLVLIETESAEAGGRATLFLIARRPASYNVISTGPNSKNIQLLTNTQLKPKVVVESSAGITRVSVIHP